MKVSVKNVCFHYQFSLNSLKLQSMVIYTVEDNIIPVLIQNTNGNLY